MKRHLIAMLLVACQPLHAELYKCTVNGRTLYTEKPCATGGTRLAGSAGDGENPHQSGQTTCQAAVLNQIRFLDPYNVQIGAAQGGTPEIFEIGLNKVMARKFTIAINAKNLQGAYVGDRQAICFTSQDGRRLLRVDASAMHPGTLN